MAKTEQNKAKPGILGAFVRFLRASEGKNCSLTRIVLRGNIKI